MEERLQKVLANCGVDSRRKCEQYILDGRVKVNGVVVNQLGAKVDVDKDEIYFDDKKINNNVKKIYIILNKPIGYVTTVKDQFNRDTVLDLIKISERLVPVGRLDMYTSGALLLSNDGEFINRITHPSHEIEKKYNVTIIGIVSKEDIAKLEEGVIIDDDYKTRPARVKILKIDQEKNRSRIQITIHEGKNRQIRKMIEAIGKRVEALHRCQIGFLNVKDLKIGEWRHLTKEEVKKLLK